MKTRIIQDQPDDDTPAATRPAPAAARTRPRPRPGPHLPGIASAVRRYPLVAFFGLAYALAWWGWPLYAVGVVPEPLFFACGPLIAALIVVSVTEGRVGLRSLGSRLLRWRVGWIWYVVALGLPLAVRLLSAELNVALGAPAVAFSGLAWSSFALVFGMRLINPLDGPLGEEPGWRGYALPRLQINRSPMVAAVFLAALVAGWHLPLVAMGQLAPVGLPATFAITIVYVWLFNRTGGSVLLTMLFHSCQGALQPGDHWFTGTVLARQQWLEFLAWSAVAAGVLLLDRTAWRQAPDSAKDLVPPLAARS